MRIPYQIRPGEPPDERPYPDLDPSDVQWFTTQLEGVMMLYQVRESDRLVVVKDVYASFMEP